MEIIPITIASKKPKYLGINLTKDMNDLYKESYKLLKKATEEDYRRWLNEHSKNGYTTESNLHV
jgi:predicted HicB family RNase H-like nuclease